MIINPMVKGSFKNFVLINAKRAERTVRTVTIVKISIVDLLGALKYQQNRRIYIGNVIIQP